MLLDLFKGRVSLRYLDQPGILPYAPSDFGEAASATFGEARAPDLFDMSLEAMRRKYAAAIADFQKATGETLHNPMEPHGAGKGSRMPSEAERKAVDERLANARKVFAQIPDPLRFEAEIADEAKALREKAAKSAALTVGWGGAGAFSGSMAGLMTRPSQLALLPLGGPEVAAGRSLAVRLLALALRDAGVAAGGQAITEALDYQSRSRFGTQQTLEEAMRNIGMAAFGGAIIGSGARALAAGGRGLLKLGRRTLAVRDSAHVAEGQAFDAAAAHGAPRAHNDAMAAAVRDVAEAETPQPGLFAPAPDLGAAAAAGVTAEPALGKVFTPAGRTVEVRQEVVEAASLVTSHGADLTTNPAYPAELQPRDRTRAASEAQITSMAGALEPARLTGGAEAGTGAPIVGPDGVVESGNGRTLAIRKAYAEGGAEAYRAHLAELGYDVAGMKEPVLIRRRVTGMSPEERVAFAREANEAATMALGTAEQALADARRIPDAVLDLYQGGAVDLAKNADFVRQVMRALPESERAAMMTKDGGLSVAGTKRVEAAMLAKAYGDSGLITKLTEASDNDIKAIGGALQDAAPAWAQMRARVAAGQLTPEVDATAHLLAAIRMVERARKDGAPVGDLIAQGQMFGEGLTEAAYGFLRLFYRDGDLRKAAGRSAIGGKLAAYLDEANKSVPGQNLFGEAPVGATDILRAKVDAAALQRGRDVEAATEAMDAPEIDQALEADVARILDASDIEVPMAEEVVDGATTAKTGSARELMKAADERVKAAKQVQACALGLAAE